MPKIQHEFGRRMLGPNEGLKGFKELGEQYQQSYQFIPHKDELQESLNEIKLTLSRIEGKVNSNGKYTLINGIWR